MNVSDSLLLFSSRLTCRSVNHLHRAPADCRRHPLDPGELYLAGPTPLLRRRVTIVYITSSFSSSDALFLFLSLCLAFPAPRLIHLLFLFIFYLQTTIPSTVPSPSSASCRPIGLSTSASSAIVRPPVVPTAHNHVAWPSWIAHRAPTPHRPQPSVTLPLIPDHPPSMPRRPARSGVYPPLLLKHLSPHCKVNPLPRHYRDNCKMNCETTPAALIISET